MFIKPKPLTPRERQVLCHVRDGRSNKQIARDLGIRPDTVNNHLKVAYAKLGVTGRTQAVLVAIQTGQISLDDADVKGGGNVENYPHIVAVGGRAGTADRSQEVTRENSARYPN